MDASQPPEDPKEDMYLDEVETIFHELVDSIASKPVISYVPQLTWYFARGGELTRIRSLELILSILVDKIEDPPPHIKKVLLKRMEQNQKNDEKPNGKTKSVPESNIQYFGKKNINKKDILAWLHDTLPNEIETKVFTTYFIFIKTYWQHLQSVEPEIYDSLYKLHKKLLKNVKYGKLEALERLQRSWYPPTYKPLR